jgi:hypothetical protein
MKNILTKRTTYLDKEFKTVSVMLEDRTVNINIFNRYTKVPNRESFKRKIDTSYNVKEMIEQTTGIKNV